MGKVLFVKLFMLASTVGVYYLGYFTLGSYLNEQVLPIMILLNWLCGIVDLIILLLLFLLFNLALEIYEGEN
jgi:hypothetical protein